MPALPSIAVSTSRTGICRCLGVPGPDVTSVLRCRGAAVVTRVTQGYWHQRPSPGTEEYLLCLARSQHFGLDLVSVAALEIANHGRIDLESRLLMQAQIQTEGKQPAVLCRSSRQVHYLLAILVEVPQVGVHPLIIAKTRLVSTLNPAVVMAPQLGSRSTHWAHLYSRIMASICARVAINHHTSTLSCSIPYLEI